MNKARETLAEVLPEHSNSIEKENLLEELEKDELAEALVAAHEKGIVPKSDIFKRCLLDSALRSGGKEYNSIVLRLFTKHNIDPAYYFDCIEQLQCNYENLEVIKEVAPLLANRTRDRCFTDMLKRVKKHGLKAVKERAKKKPI